MKRLCSLITLVVLIVSSTLAADDAIVHVGESFDLKISGVPADDAQLINSDYIIDGDGNLNLAYIGKIHVAEKTLSEIKHEIERAYIDRGIFPPATLTVTITVPATPGVMVTGAVNSRGSVPYKPSMTLMGAIRAAGGFTIYARSQKVHLIRGTNTQVIECKKIQKDPSLDIAILPGDRIEVLQGPIS